MVVVVLIITEINSSQAFFPHLPAAVQNNHLLLQVDQILISSKAAALSGLLT